MTSCTFPPHAVRYMDQYLTPPIPTCYKSSLPLVTYLCACNFVHPSRLTLDSVMSFHLAIRIFANMAQQDKMHLGVGVCLLSCRPCWDHCVLNVLACQRRVELHAWTQLLQTLPEMWWGILEQPGSYHQWLELKDDCRGKANLAGVWPNSWATESRAKQIVLFNHYVVGMVCMQQ